MLANIICNFSAHALTSFALASQTGFSLLGQRRSVAFDDAPPQLLDEMNRDDEELGVDSDFLNDDEELDQSIVTWFESPFKMFREWANAAKTQSMLIVYYPPSDLRTMTLTVGSFEGSWIIRWRFPCVPTADFTELCKDQPSLHEAVPTICKAEYAGQFVVKSSSGLPLSKTSAPSLVARKGAWTSFVCLLDNPAAPVFLDV